MIIELLPLSDENIATLQCYLVFLKLGAFDLRNEYSGFWQLHEPSIH